MSRDALLERLQAPPTAEPRRARNRGAMWLVLAAILAILAGGIGFAALRPDRPRVDAVEAKLVQPVSGASQGTLLEGSGYVVARRQATVSSKVTGRVDQVLIEEGQQVVRGQVIARLDASNADAALAQAQAEKRVEESNLAAAIDTYEAARNKLQRISRLHTSGFLSDQALEDQQMQSDRDKELAEAARRRLEAANATIRLSESLRADTVITAPFAGVVTDKAAQPGEIVSPVSAGGGFTRTGIGTIVDMDSLEVDVDVAESVINRVAADMPVTIRLNAYPDATMRGVVTAIVPTADRSKGTVSVHVRLAQARDPRMLPDMAAQVSFLAAAPELARKSEAQLFVPASAVRKSAKGESWTYVISGGMVARRAIKPGRSLGANVAVDSGLMPGEVVVAHDLDGLKDGQRVIVHHPEQIR